MRLQDITYIFCSFSYWIYHSFTIDEPFHSFNQVKTKIRKTKTYKPKSTKPIPTRITNYSHDGWKPYNGRTAQVKTNRSTEVRYDSDKLLKSVWLFQDEPKIITKDNFHEYFGNHRNRFNVIVKSLLRVEE